MNETVENVYDVDLSNTLVALGHKVKKFEYDYISETSYSAFEKTKELVRDIKKYKNGQLKVDRVLLEEAEDDRMWAVIDVIGDVYHKAVSHPAKTCYHFAENFTGDINAV